MGDLDKCNRHSLLKVRRSVAVFDQVFFFMFGQRCLLNLRSVHLSGTFDIWYIESSGWMIGPRR